jgi:DNA-binding NarL/FixJ family response regulator
MAWSTGPEYQRIRVVIGDCAPELSQAIRASLEARGVVDIAICDTIDGLYRALDEKIVDLLIYDYHLLGARFIEVMQKIRRREVGRNPFLTVVATIRESSLETVRRLIDGGVDELLQSPAPPDRLFAVIDKSIRRRKPFMVTYDYVGPARPAARRDAIHEAAQLRVPHTLKSRLLERKSDLDIEATVTRAAEMLSQRQIQSCGAEIDALAQHVADICNGSEDDDNNRAMYGALLKIGAVADDLSLRANGTSLERVSALIATLTPIAQRIIEAPMGRANTEIRLLSQLAAAVRRALSTDDSAPSAIREIADAVDGFARRPPPAPGQLSIA